MLGVFSLFIVEILGCGVLLQPSENNIEQNGAAIILLIINTIVCSFILYRITDNKKLNIAFLTSFILRIGILLWDVYARDIFILPNSEADAVYYHLNATRYAFVYPNKVSINYYGYYVGQLYKIIGGQKVTIQFFHVFFAICSIFLIYKILKMFDVREEIVERTIFIMCFLPNNMMVTTFFLQESVIAFVLIASLYLYTKWWFGGSVFYFAAGVACSVLIARLHSGGLVCAVGFLMMIVLMRGKERKVKINVGTIILVVVAAYAMLILLNTFGEGNVSKIGGGVTAESIIRESEIREDGGSGYIIGISGLPPAVDVVVNTPIRMFYFIFSPLPWDWRSFSDVFAFVFSVLFYLITIIMTIRAYRATKIYNDVDSIKSYMLLLVVIIIVAAVMFGWGVSNSGSALRHREKFTYIYATLFGIASEIIERAKDKKNGKEVIRYSSCL